KPEWSSVRRRHEVGPRLRPVALRLPLGLHRSAMQRQNQGGLRIVIALHLSRLNSVILNAPIDLALERFPVGISRLAAPDPKRLRVVFGPTALANRNSQIFGLPIAVIFRPGKAER